MADRPVITTIPSGGVYDTDTLTNNFTKIRDEFDNLLSRKGTAAANNSIDGDLDFAGNGARNLGIIAPIGGPTETVGTIEQLRSSTNPEGSIVQVLGYYAAGDGGGGLFYLDSGSSAADDGSLVIVDADGNRWRKITDRKLKARWFGAKLDGTTDDLPAITAALTVAYAFGGGEVVLDASEEDVFVVIDGNLVIPENCGLVAEGVVTIRPHLDEAAFGSTGMVSMSDNSWLRGLTFTSEKSDGTFASGHQLFHRTTTLGRTATKVKFDYCKFTNSSPDGLEGYDTAYLGAGFEDWTFSNCEFTGAGRNNVSIISGTKARFFQCLFGGEYLLYNVDLEANNGDTGISDVVFEDCVVDCSLSSAFEKSLIISGRSGGPTERVYLRRCRFNEANLRLIARSASDDMNKIYVEECDIDGAFIADTPNQARGIVVRNTKFSGAMSGPILDGHFDNVMTTKCNLNMNGTTVFENSVISGGANNSVNMFIRDKSKFINNIVYSLADSSDAYSGLIRLTNPADSEFAGRGEQLVGNQFLNGGGAVKTWRLFYLSSLALVANNVFEDGTTSSNPVDTYVKIGEGLYRHFTGSAAPSSGSFPRGSVGFASAASSGSPIRHTNVGTLASPVWVTEYLPAFGSTTWDPPDLASGSTQTTTVTCPGAALGDAVTVGFSGSQAGTFMYGYVNAADTVTVVHGNLTGSNVNLGSGTLRVKAEKIG